MPRKPALPTTPETPVKATDAEILRRVATVHKLLVAGASRASIQQYAASQWGLSERPVDEYISRAKAILVEQMDATKDNNLAIALERMNDIYQKCMSASNFKGAIAAQTEINKLTGIYSPSKMEHSGHVSMSWADMVIQASEGGKHDSD